MRTAYIGMGGNMASWTGTPEQTLAAAASRLNSLGRILNRSSLYSTAPVGFADQPRYVNAVIELETDLEPPALLAGLMAIEQEFGRDRATSFSNGPRTLDLDILLFGELRLSEPGLQIPHPRLAERLFVLVPLAEIASNLDAGSGKTVAHLIDTLHASVKSGSDAAFPIQSGSWRAGADRGDLHPGAGLRTSRHDDDHPCGG
jgi:2-amino-4-hydroxy-6-hydroxymethyldihydropteridine diphosphokinase